jgi:chromosome segregation ATPase
MADPKMVPETDLIALKESHAGEMEAVKREHSTALTTAEATQATVLETAKGEHGKETAGLQSQVNTSQEELSRLRATVAQLEEGSKNHTATAEQVKGLQGDIKTANANLKIAEDGLAGNLRAQLTGEFKIPEKALEAKTPAELKLILDTLAATRVPGSNSYTAGGGSGGSTPTKPAEKIKAGLAAGDLQSQ